MYYQNYEDYMKSILGYPREDQNTYENYIEEKDMYAKEIEKIEKFYPDIYRKVDSLIEEPCSRCTKSIEKEDLESMVDSVYNKIEADNNELIANIGANQNRDIRQRRPNNNLMRDLIKILILDKLKLKKPAPKPPCCNDFRPPIMPPPGPWPMDNYLRF